MPFDLIFGTFEERNKVQKELSSLSNNLKLNGDVSFLNRLNELLDHCSLSPQE